ncbi:MAG: hypothetical protein V2I97_03660 [Desulfococcaceae bacterium]|nr:hypothetical protein [Desulfococcaceae bacterium]
MTDPNLSHLYLFESPETTKKWQWVKSFENPPPLRDNAAALPR